MKASSKVIYKLLYLYFTLSSFARTGNIGGLTPGITRRPERLIYMRAVVSAVGCMPLLARARCYHS